jgi:ribonuclease HI
MILLWTRRAQTALSRAVRRNGWKASLEIEQRVASELRLAADHLKSVSRPTFHAASATTIRLATDASKWGWGAVVQIHGETRHLQGRWTPREASFHINRLEARAILMALLQISLPRGSTIAIQSDSMTLVCALNRMTTRSKRVAAEVEELSAWLQRRRARIVAATFIPGRENIIPDQLSRSWSKSRAAEEWPIARYFVGPLLAWARMDPTVQVDLFSSSYNHIPQAETFVTRLPELGALATDAFSLRWKEFSSAFINPPFSCMLRVTAKLIQDRPGKALLISPNWPTAPWFNTLNSIAKASIVLPATAVGSGPFTQLQEPLRNPKWLLRAWAL